MPSQSSYPTATAVNAGSGDVDWTFPPGGNRAQATIPGSSGTTRVAVFSGFSFGIPSSATIDGIAVEVLRRNAASPASEALDLSVTIAVAGATGTSDDQPSVVEWPASSLFESYGGAADLWGLSGVTADLVNAYALGGTGGLSVRLSATLDPDATPEVLDVVATVHYTPGGGPSRSAAVMMTI